MINNRDELAELNPLFQQVAGCDEHNAGPRILAVMRRLLWHDWPDSVSGDYDVSELSGNSRPQGASKAELRAIIAFAETAADYLQSVGDLSTVSGAAKHYLSLRLGMVTGEYSPETNMQALVHATGESRTKLNLSIRAGKYDVRKEGHKRWIRWSCLSPLQRQRLVERIREDEQER